MSVKSKLKSAGKVAGKAAFHFVLGWMLDRYASKRVTTAVKGVLEAAVSIKANQPPDLQLAIDLALKDTLQLKPKFEAEMQKMRSDLGALLERNLSEQAASLRGRK